MKIALPIVILLLLVGGVVLFTKSENSPKPVNPGNASRTENLDSPSNQESSSVVEESTTSSEKTYITNLKDVSQGNLYRYTQFTGDSSGKVTVTYSSDLGYDLVATFKDLPEPAPQTFYEGWIVTSGETIDVVSTGRVELDEGGNFVNNFSNDQDLTDHTLYVLTIEPEDGDPAPAEHILEGILVLQN